MQVAGGCPVKHTQEAAKEECQTKWPTNWLLSLSLSLSLSQINKNKVKNNNIDLKREVS